jgi:exonuclease III
VEERREQWLEWMKKQNPDIVSLQELNEYTSDKLKEDAKIWGHPFSEILKEDGFPTGVTSRYPIDDLQRIRKGFHHGLLRVKIQEIFFYIIHLHPSNWRVRVKEINFILDDIRNLPKNASIILVGDFNSFSRFDSSYYAHGTLEPFFQHRDEVYNEKNLNNSKLDYSAIDLLLENGFVDLEYVMRGEGYRFSGSFPTLIEKSGDHGSRRRLDYVFASSDLIKYVHRAAIIADPSTLILSDHLPVIVDLVYK